MKKLLFSLFLIYSINSNSQVIYSDEFDAGINKLNGFDNLISSLDNNTLKITGNGNAGAWDNIRYSFHNNGINTAIDASSSPKIYIKLKAENSPTVRVDFVDANGYSTSLYGLTAKPTDEYQVFELNYTDRLVDGGYGGPCSSGPCNLDATNLVELAFYVNPGTGGYSGNINIEWISIGESLEKEPDLNLKNAKVIGYLPDYRFSLSSQIHYEQLTHLMLCFANPDFFGNLIMTDFTQIVNDAKTLNPDIKIFLSLAGGLDHNSATAGYWKDILLYPTQRTAFIDKIVDYAKQKNLDGIDIDLEFDLVTQGYSEFVIELAGKLKTENIEITAAFPKVYYDNLTQDALEVFDFINLMAYDNAGFWSPSPAQHSSYTFAEDNINFWKTTGKISPEKLILGVPFYGHNFDTYQWVTYGEMVTQSSSNANVDQIGNTFYNGIPTIEKKVELAHKKVGGIMIWELAQDSFTEYSLLNAIHEKYTELDVTTTGLGSNSVTLSSEDFDLSSNIKLYPNPVNNVLNFSQNLTDIVHSFELYDLTGRKIVTANIENKSQIDVSSLSKGLYSIIFKTKKGSITKRIMKQ